MVLEDPRMPDVSLSLSEKTQRQLPDLGEWLKSSPEQVLEQAIAELYEHAFWPAVNAGYAALRADPAAWAEVEAERKLWDQTLMDGLDRMERWSDDGDRAPPADMGLAS